jgi:hypothetical protein
MSSQIIDWNAPSLQRTLPALPKDLPHGLIVPPQEVRDEIAASDEKLQREHGFILNEEARVRELSGSPDEPPRSPSPTSKALGNRGCPAPGRTGPAPEG